MRKSQALIIAISLFCSFFYCCIGFQYGVDNNEEELPLIYEAAGFAKYNKDPFVQQSLSQFNAGSLYVAFMGKIGSNVGIEIMPYVYFTFHFLTLLLLCFAIISILKSLHHSKGYSFLIVLLSLLLFNVSLHLIPNQRSLFWGILDPEFIVVTILLAAIAFFIEGQQKTSMFFLFIGTLIHPLYSLPVGGTFVLISLFPVTKNKKESLYQGVLYTLCILPYSILLWYFSRKHALELYDPSLLHELVRAPHHLTIPSVGSGNFRSYLRFFGSTLLMFVVTFWCWENTDSYRKPKNIFRTLKATYHSLSYRNLTPIEKLFAILFLLLIYLGMSSLVASFIRIPILVQLTPYRTGIFVFVILTIFCFHYSASFLSKRINLPYLPLLYYTIPLVIAFISLQCTNFNKTTNSESRNEAIEWINSNTSQDALFLNYTDIDVRTSCLRSDFFRFKTIPLHNSGQIDWYQRLLIYYEIPEHIYGKKYKEVAIMRKDHLRIIDFNLVLKKALKWEPEYLLLTSESKLKSYEQYPLLFKNNMYRIYLLNH